MVFADAVHFAPHRLIDFESLGVASHMFGLQVLRTTCRNSLWTSGELNQLAPYKLRPATDDLPGEWMTGTQNHEGIAGTAAAVDYLASLASETISNTQPRSALVSAFDAIQAHENQLLEQLLDGLAEIAGLRVWGITASQRLSDRVPTVSFTWPGHDPQHLSEQLAAHGIYVWLAITTRCPSPKRLDWNRRNAACRIATLQYDR